MTDQVEVQETEEQAAARIRRARARKALAAAPEVAYQLRWDSVPLDGHTERGDLPTQRTPLLTDVTDAADYLYARIQGWAEFWAGQLSIPAPGSWLWRNYQESHKGSEFTDNEMLGFRADTTPEEASHLVSSSASWLLWHETGIAELFDAEQERYELDVADTIWKLRARAGMIPKRRRHGVALTDVSEFSTRPCPECHKDLVRIEYFGEPMEAAEARGEAFDPTPIRGQSDEDAANEFMASIAGVRVECTGCRWSPRLRPTAIAKWLVADAVNPAGPVARARASLKREGDRNWRAPIG